MIGRLIQSAVNFVVLIGLTLLLPLFCMAAWLRGSKDEQSLMKVLFCVLSPSALAFGTSSSAIWCSDGGRVTSSSSSFSSSPRC
jgi:hypothetical protein